MVESMKMIEMEERVLMKAGGMIYSGKLDIDARSCSFLCHEAQR